MAYTIELDCAPGTPRPDALLPQVLAGTGLELDEPVSTFFGNWTWAVPADQEEKYLAAKPVLAERIKALYNAGAIRYGSW